MKEITHITVGGGAGDLIHAYFNKKKWLLLENVKKRFPDIYVAVVLAVHNSAASEFIARNPNVDIVVTQRWSAPKDKQDNIWEVVTNSIDIVDFAKMHNIEPSKQKLYLNEKEDKVLDDLVKDKYIVCHPFAGLAHRGCTAHMKDGSYSCYPDYLYKKLLRLFIEDGYRVVLLGRSENNMWIARNRKEEFDLSGDNVINLIDKTSLRLSAEITRQASGFIGSHSSMMVAAWSNKVPSVFFYPTISPAGKERTLKKSSLHVGTWALDEPWTYGYQMEPKDFMHLRPIKVFNKLKELMK